MAYVLAGDVGATKVFLRVLEVEQRHIVAEYRYASADFSSLSSLVQSFQSEFDFPQLSSACFGLPGPVQGRRAELTNLPWMVDADELETTCQIGRVDIINDFYAAALGVDEVGDDDFITLQKGEFDTAGNRLVVGAGSGLGVAPVKNCNGHFIPQPSEGGHMDFAPNNEQQVEILAWLHQKWSHVSYERLLSGEGLETLYFFYSLEAHGAGQRIMRAAEVHEAALAGEDVALKALATFVEVYGAYVGNAALIWEAKAGIFIAGGIAPKIRDWMERPEFINAFLNKGRMKKIVEKLPVYLVTNEKVGLLGAMKRAMELHDQQPEGIQANAS